MVSKYDKSSEVNLFLFLFNYIIGFVFYLRGVNTNKGKFVLTKASLLLQNKI